MKTDSDGKIVGYPAIADDFDAFSTIMECLNDFEVSSRPVMHVAVPMMYKTMQHLDLVA